MARVICKLPNAAEEISGVRFVASDGGMLSDDISDESAAYFASIPGYALVASPPEEGDTKGGAVQPDTKSDPPAPSKKTSKASQ